MSVDHDVVRRITLAPDAGLVKSLGANHTLESAIADLVDNSIDAGATNVSVRLLTQGDRLVEVEVHDNGRGMDAESINAAMTIGHQRAYTQGDLGHFGMGLKAASFGHSDVLTVWSSKYAAIPVGRRIRRADFSRDFTCEVLSADAAAQHGSERQAILGSAEGTSVIWTEVRNAYRGHSMHEARQWLATRNDALRAHLGVTFHRLLAEKRLQINVLVDERNEALAEPGIPVMPINPFGYARSGHPQYPKHLIAAAGDTRVKLACHIWPAKSDITGFRIGAKPGEQFQGFYIYRNDRLLQIGGWSDTANPSAARQLARVVLEDTDAIGHFLTMNPEKSGLKFEPIFHDAVSRAAAADGTTFIEYLQDAESVYAEANKRKRKRNPVIRPDKGFAPAVRKRIGSELPYIQGDSIDLKWRRMPEGEFFDVDLRSKTLSLNSRYRPLFAPNGGSLNDAPVLKALMFLLTHHLFEGQHLGARDKDEIALWKSILGAAVIAEQRMRGWG
ncbi:DNA mismatch repair protein [Mycobacterium sp. 1165196.3]|uniref:ATP-binding protein n=1 Tax=unclassified Mycobacterium TaxID=2642494 RepID=UPI0007FBDD79|nr:MULTISPECIES: ATP-binding protein [unclassified Mycobacterium]OBK39017.1 DNA mismatch repair protein [Mycobacterium sp. 1165196.3]OBK98781.1 DNA mismatch repair protein [Mycobacterium sp. 1245499.0]